MIEIETVIFECPAFWVFFGREGTVLHRCRAKAAHMCRPPAGGEIWELEGAAQEDRRHGVQFEVAAAVIQRIGCDNISHFLARHPRFKGIGLGRARIAALAALGTTFVALLNAGDTAELGRTVPIEVATELVIGWREMSAETGFLQWCGKHGISGPAAMKAYQLLGPKGEETLRVDPYLLVAVMPFAAVDVIGRRLGVSASDTRRQVGAVKSAFYEMLGTGSTACDPAWLVGRAGAILGEQGVEAVAAAIDADVAHPTLAGLQPTGCSQMERSIEERFTEMLEMRRSPPSVEPCITALGQHLLPAQASAVRAAFTHQLSVLCGGAGTGKTTALKVIVQAASELSIPVVMAAVAGQAAGRMRSATGHHAKTLAALFHEAVDRPIPSGALVIIDESSMVDLPTMHRLLEFVPHDASMLFVGDPSQLAPPGFGLVFHIMAASDCVPRVELTQIMRQRAESGIPVVAQAIRAGALPALPSFSGPAEGVSFVESNDPVADAVSVWKDLVQSPDDVADIQVLTALRRDVRDLNSLIQTLRGGKPHVALSEWGFRTEDRIVCTRNDYQIGVWNGSLGVIHGTAVDHDKTVFTTTIDGEPVLMPDAYMGHVELGYAVTIHKSQGSQFPRIVVPVTSSRVLDRALLYTAVTRAQTQVVLVGNRGVLAAAVEAPPAASRRNVAFGLRRSLNHVA